MDFVQQMGALALGTRLKRLTDHLYSETNKIYEACGISLKSRGFIVLMSLDKKGPLSVVEIADTVGSSHPAISQIVSDMMKDGLLERTPDPTDERRKVLSLSETARKIIHDAQPVWKAISDSIEDISEMKGGNFLETLTEFENKVANEPFSNIVLNSLDEDHSGVHIVPFKAEFAPWLGMIHLSWMIELFPNDIEPSDWDTYARPEEKVVKPGGQIFFALGENNIPIGTCAVIKQNTATFELTKMGVMKDHRHKGIGRALVHHAIAFAKQAGAEELVLETGADMTPAIHLYEEFGFIAASPPNGTFGTNRADYFMRLTFDGVLS